MKKEYMKPQMTAVEIQNESLLVNLSIGEGSSADGTEYFNEDND